MRALLAMITGEKERGVTYREISSFIAGLSSYWLMLGSAAQIKEGKQAGGGGGVGRGGGKIKSPVVKDVQNVHTRICREA